MRSVGALGAAATPKTERVELRPGEDGEGWVLLGLGPVFFYLGREVEEEGEGGDGEGESVGGPTLLQPCYTVEMGENGGRVIFRCLPYGAGLFGGDVPVEIEHYDTRVDLEGLTEGERAIFVKLVKEAEAVKNGVRTQHRAANAGIVVAK